MDTFGEKKKTRYYKKVDGGWKEMVYSAIIIVYDCAEDARNGPRRMAEHLRTVVKATDVLFGSAFRSLVASIWSCPVVLVLPQEIVEAVLMIGKRRRHSLVQLLF